MNAGVPKRDDKRILGLSLGGLEGRVYGGGEARLKAAYAAIERAHGKTSVSPLSRALYFS